MTLQCWNCGRSLDDVPRPISRHEHCRDCFEALHSCRLCRYYRTDVNSRCNEERADPPMNKENANFCDFFRPVGGVYSSKRSQRSGMAQSSLDSLFIADDRVETGTNESESSPAGEADSAKTVDTELDAEAAARARLNSLFSKD